MVYRRNTPLPTFQYVRLLEAELGKRGFDSVSGSHKSIHIKIDVGIDRNRYADVPYETLIVSWDHGTGWRWLLDDPISDCPVELSGLDVADDANAPDVAEAVVDFLDTYRW